MVYDGGKNHKKRTLVAHLLASACSGRFLAIIVTLGLLLAVLTTNPQLLRSAGDEAVNAAAVGTTQQGGIMIPECDSSPWKPDEDLVGNCPGELQSKPDFSSSPEKCAMSCCDDPDCITWQYRRDAGCLQGPDVRIGQEKDGPGAYCSDHPPFRWKGQFVKGVDRKQAECTTATWHPDEQPGQCFGLGDVRPGISAAEDCMKACCSDEGCGAWQFATDLGCFYGGDMHACQASDDPIVFENFIGRRKQVRGRTYVGEDGQPAKNWKSK